MLNVDETMEWYVRDVEILAHAQILDDRSEPPLKQLLRRLEPGDFINPSDEQIALLNAELNLLCARRHHRLRQTWHLGMLIARAYFKCTENSAMNHMTELSALPMEAQSLVEALFR